MLEMFLLGFGIGWLGALVYGWIFFPGTCKKG